MITATFADIHWHKKCNLTIHIAKVHGTMKYDLYLFQIYIETKMQLNHSHCEIS